MVGGDFNVILNEEEKQGGLPFTNVEAQDFATFVANYALIDLKYKGSSFTWWNGREGEDCMFKRLDRILVNQDSYIDALPTSESHHLIRQGSDHAPLHVVCNSKEEPV